MLTTTSRVRKIQSNAFDPQNFSAIIIAGDFNCHHPLWNLVGYIRDNEEADALIEMMAELAIPSGTVTYPRAGTAINLVWANDEAMHQVPESTTTGGMIYPLRPHCWQTGGEPAPPRIQLCRSRLGQAEKEV